MITVRVETNVNKIQTITVSGHANYKAYGEDLICAGVSAIMFGLCNALDELKTKSNYEIKTNQFKIQSDLSTKSNTILNTGLVQLQTIAESYPKNIKIIKMEV